MKVPLNGDAVPATTTDMPTKKPCAEDVVIVATLEVSDRFEILADPIVPELFVALKVTAIPNGRPNTRSPLPVVLVAFVAVAANV